MKNKFKILVIAIVSAITLVGCDDAETKEFKSLHKLGYEQALKEYSMVKDNPNISNQSFQTFGNESPISKLENKISPDTRTSNSLSYDERFENDDAYKKYEELKKDEFNNNEKIQALLYGYRKGFFDSVKNSVEFVSSKKGEKSINDYLNKIKEINGLEISSATKLELKNTIINYANIVLEQLNIYEKENGEYIGALVPISEDLQSIDDEFTKFLFEDGYKARLYMAFYAYKDVWHEQE